LGEGWGEGKCHGHVHRGVPSPRPSLGWRGNVSGIARALLVLFAALPVHPTAAQDTVYVSSASNPQGYLKLSGRIADYSGEGLNIELTGGVPRSIPAEQILKIETNYSRPQVEADRLFAQGEFESALALYSQARTGESRAWVRRQITAQIVWCDQALERWPQAGEEFLVLVRSDPATIHFHCIPLAWLPSEPSRSLEQAARQWLSRDDLPAAVLLGASHLLPTSAGPNALARLKQLTATNDPRVAQLALAQTWRTVTVNADVEQLKTWSRLVDQMQEPLRAGPYYVLGLGFAQHQQYEQAALAWMRLPLLYPQHRQLAMRSLQDAGQALERLGRPRQAATLYAELLQTYPNTREATDARDRLEEMQKSE
jgi:tetratricopeptide (TPR) repeat protein